MRAEHDGGHALAISSSIAPRPGGGLTHASAELRTPYGLASVAWTRTGDTLTVTATVPPGTRAEVDLPGTAPTEVGAGTHTFTGPCPPPDR